jgi:sulfite reductase (NADPH) hemoprotein beta-component
MIILPAGVAKITAHASALRRNAMACVALPTCGLALAESERYLPSLVTALEERLVANGLAEDEIVIRMTGCPNGCARPYLSEIGLVGKRRAGATV